jgi:hypothetical protein
MVNSLRRSKLYRRAPAQDLRKITAATAPQSSASVQARDWLSRDLAQRRPRGIRAAGGKMILLGRPASELQKRLVLVADEFDHFRTVSHNAL